jgi:uncharacterized membrane protein
MHAATQRFSSRFTWSGYLLGFALSGFFDGILLHQILQWHHLLTGLEGEAFRDLRVQVLADGLFHVLMYAIAVAGLGMLWRSRADLTQPFAGRHLLACALIGFGAWHVLDGVLFHWMLALHRIRTAPPSPLFWDLLWFFIFGVAVIFAGLVLRRGSGAGSARVPHEGMAASVALTLAAVLSAHSAALPPPASSAALVVLRPGVSASDFLDGLSETRAGILWADPSGAVWTVRLESGRDARALYAHGALLVTASPVVLGCLAWGDFGGGSGGFSEASVR